MHVGKACRLPERDRTAQGGGELQFHYAMDAAVDWK
jgi:hypothetical protein